MDLKDKRWTTKSRWPILLSSLRALRVLSVDRGNGYLMSSKRPLREELKKLSPTIREMKLVGADVEISLLNVTSYEQEGEENPLSMISHYKRGDSRMWNIGEAFPELRKFDFSGGPNFLIRWADFAALPDKLVSLTAPSMDWDDKDPDQLAALPRSLTFLNTPLYLSGPALTCSHSLSLLPPELNYIYSIHGAPIECWKSLPSSLLQFGNVPWDLTSWDEDALKCVPEHTLSLDIMAMDTEGPPLPKFLTSLSISSPFNLKLTPKYIETLPKTLESLEGKFTFDWSGHVEPGDYRIWPSNLKMIRSLEPLKFQPKELYYLPRTVMRLENVALGVGVESVDLEASAFPSALTRLHFCQSTGTTRLRMTGMLPQSLTWLNVGMMMLDDEALHTLPTALSYLSMPYIYVSDMHKTQIAVFGAQSKLVELRMDGIDFDDFICLPRTLTTLILADLRGSFSKIQKSNDSTDLFEDLPSGLEVLSIATRDQPFSAGPPPTSLTIAGKSLSSLTRLTHLSIRKNFTVHPQVLCHLSHKILTLSIELSHFDSPLYAFPPYPNYVDLNLPLDPLPRLPKFKCSYNALTDSYQLSEGFSSDQAFLLACRTPISALHNITSRALHYDIRHVAEERLNEAKRISKIFPDPR